MEPLCDAFAIWLGVLFWPSGFGVFVVLVILFTKKKGVSNGVQGAWMITGDFNCPLEQDDRIGMTVQSNEMRWWILLIVFPFATWLI